MTPRIQRAQLLYDQSRYDQAISELRQELTFDPQNAYTHALLALSLCQLKQYGDALLEARQAVHLAPDFPFAHYVTAFVLYRQNKYRDADTALQQAIHFDPYDADFFALRGQIALEQSRWRDALMAAETGLAIESEHMACTNLRATALVKLGQRDAAAVVLESALARDPENAWTHTNRGWAYLNQGDHKRALEHFREALRLEPDNSYARQGIVEALKARNVLYRQLLRYFLWMSRLNKRTQWMLLVGGYIGSNLLRDLSHQNPDLAPSLLPIRIAYFIFVFLIWTAEPLFNLLLRLDPFGRLVLTREQVTASNWIGACLFGALSALSFWLRTQSDTALVAMIVSGLMMIPIAATFGRKPEGIRTFLTAYTLGLGIIGSLSVFGAPLLGSGVADSLFGIFLLGVAAFTWISNLLPHR